MKRRTSCLRGVGIDLVSKARVRQFLTRHREMILKRFLNLPERRKFKDISVTDLAELFTAKEAFFKACGEAWMGLEGFQGMRILERNGDSFKMRWKLAHANRSYAGSGCFFRDGDLVGAQTMVWS